MRHGIEYYRRYRVRELAASQLQAKLAVAQLEVLKMQLQPHFLFNTLHAVSTLMYRDVEGADRMVTRLSDFLRLTLDSAGVQEVTLIRDDLLVPNLVLQPLVENAVRPRAHELPPVRKKVIYLDHRPS
jgi:LytS/YehU family sensor histidine kinase